MVAAVESMAFVGTTPWHGLGNEVTDEAAQYDYKLFIERAGLNWEAEKRRLFRAAPGVGERSYIDADAWEIVRKSDEKVLAPMVGERYTILQNEEAFAWFHPWLESKEAALHTGGALFEGSRIWALAKLNRDPMEIAAGDIVEKYVLLSHSHDGSLAVRVGYTPIRVVCANTLAMAHRADASKLIRLKHSKNVHTNLDNIREVMNLVNQEFEATAEQYRALVKKSINQNDLRKYVKAVFKVEADDDKIWTAKERSKELKAIVSERQKGILEDVIGLCESGRGNNLPSVKGTLWTAYQGVTEYLNYVNGRNGDNRMNSLWFGQNQKLSQSALDIAVAMAV